jgi:16S rRNA (cytosine967-C5)-methyltransferase
MTTNEFARSRRGAGRPGKKPGSGGSRSAARGRPLPAGLATRNLSVLLLSEVLNKGRAFDDALRSRAAEAIAADLEGRDRALARLIAATALRRKGELEAVLNRFLQKPLSGMRGAIGPILLSGAAQLLFLKTPPHAAIGLAVDQCRSHVAAGRFAGLVNAVLRRVATEGPAARETLNGASLNIPTWLFKRWTAAYGEELALRIADASLREASLDLSVKSNPEHWAERLGGVVLPTGTVRLDAGGRIEDRPGYEDGAWWVQDAAAALPVKLLGDVRGQDVADLCAAPGGKTALLAASGARVTAVDVSGNRFRRLKENFARLQLDTETVVADVTCWTPERVFDAVLLDAPCTATGTIRRHPDILHLKRESDIGPLAALQSRLLENAARLVKPGGTLVFCTCSLEPEEGPDQIKRFLDEHPNYTRVPVDPQEIGGARDWIEPAGDLRTLPCHACGEYEGMDGFFAARVQRSV